MASRVDAVVDEYMRKNVPSLSRAESSGNAYIKNSQKGQSASGLFQFTKNTWKSLGGSWGSDSSQAFGGLRPSVDEQNARMREYTRRNAVYLANRGINPTVGALSLAHFLGAGGAAKVWNANPNASSAAVAGSKAARANASVFNKHRTVQDLKNWAEKRAGGSPTGAYNNGASTFNTSPNVRQLLPMIPQQQILQSNMIPMPSIPSMSNPNPYQAQNQNQQSPITPPTQPQSLLSRMGVVIPSGAEYLYKAYGGQ